VSFISPEHILLALLTQHDASGKRVLDRWEWVLGLEGKCTCAAARQVQAITHRSPARVFCVCIAIHPCLLSRNNNNATTACVSTVMACGQRPTSGSRVTRRQRGHVAGRR
jgi:hypothetical protein